MLLYGGTIPDTGGMHFSIDMLTCFFLYWYTMEE